MVRTMTKPIPKPRVILVVHVRYPGGLLSERWMIMPEKKAA